MATSSTPVTTRTQKQAKERPGAGSKVRTGCITCKIRRVKCDESKPFCRRCIKFGTVCDGYTVTKPKKPSRTSTITKRSIRPIVPKTLAPDTILPMPQQSGFANEQEYQYFRLFCDRTAGSLAGYFVASLWNRIVLQACEDMPPIRHAIIALGALDKTLDITQRTEGRRYKFLLEKASEGAIHHRFALQQYGKAITQMRGTLSSKAQDYRAALILCLLTICFEALNGDMQSAQEQIRNGLKIIKEWRRSRTASKFSSSRQTFGNEELMRAFSCLENNSMMIMDAVPVMDADDEYVDEHMLGSFSSLEDARAHYEMLVSRMLHWVASAYAWGAREKDEAKRRKQPSPDASSEAKIAIDFREILEQQRQRFITYFRNWRLAFQPFWLESQKMTGSNDYMTALTIELRFKSLYTSLLGDHFKGDTVYDAFTADFREIVELAKIFVQQQKLQSDSQRATFTFDDPFISSVYFVILKCRDPNLRREAIALLESHPRRDNVMDSALMAKIGTLQMNIEEAGSEGNYIPEHARIRGIKTTTDMVKRTGQMKYLKMASSSNRDFVVHYVNFTW